MRHRAFLLFLFALFAFFSCDGNETFTVGGLSVESYSQDDSSRIVEQMNISISFVEPERNGVCCLSVDASGRVAIGTAGRGNKTILIFDSGMNFLYAISFQTEGGYSVILSEDITWIIPWRSDLCVGVASDGTVNEVLSIQRSLENTSIKNRLCRNEPIERNGSVYELRNSRKLLNWTGEYSQVVVTYADGQQKTLYDVENKLLQRQIATILALCFLLALIGVCAHYWRTSDRDTPQGGTEDGFHVQKG